MENEFVINQQPPIHFIDIDIINLTISLITKELSKTGP